MFSLDSVKVSLWLQAVTALSCTFLKADRSENGKLLAVQQPSLCRFQDSVYIGKPDVGKKSGWLKNIFNPSGQHENSKDMLLILFRIVRMF